MITQDEQSKKSLKSEQDLKLFIFSHQLNELMPMSFHTYMGYSSEEIAELLKTHKVGGVIDIKHSLYIKDLLKDLDLAHSTPNVEFSSPLPSKEQFLMNLQLAADRFCSEDDSKMLKTIINKIQSNEKDIQKNKEQCMDKNK